MMQILHCGCVAWAGGPGVCNALFGESGDELTTTSVHYTTDCGFSESTANFVMSGLHPSAPKMAGGNLFLLRGGSSYHLLSIKSGYLY